MFLYLRCIETISSSGIGGKPAPCRPRRVTAILRKTALFIALLLAVLTIFNSLAGPVAFAAPQKFTDVPANAWYFSYVENLANKNIVSGYGSGEFRPDNNVQRQHVCKMIVLAAGLPYAGKQAKFPDVDKNSEMSPYIAALQDRGIVGGFTDGTFKPRNDVTRGQASIIIAKAFGLKSGGSSGSLKDISGHYAAEQIRILASNGIVKGYADGSFKPNAPVTRAQLTKMITVAMAVAGVQKAEASPILRNFYQAQQLIDSLPSNQDPQTKTQLQAKLDALQSSSNTRVFYEKENNNSMSQANVVDLNYTGSRDYMIFGNISGTRTDKDYFRIKMSGAGRISLYSYWVDRLEYLGYEGELQIRVLNSGGTAVAVSKWYAFQNHSTATYQDIDVQVPAGDYYLEISATRSDTLFVGEHYVIFLKFFPN